MKNSELWEDYVTYTKSASDYSRQLAFAAAGICWMLKEGDFIPSLIEKSLLFIIGYFVFDIAQYVVSAEYLRSWIEKEEKKLQIAGKDIFKSHYKKPPRLDYPARWLLRLKILSLAVGYLLIGWDVFNR